MNLRFELSADAKIIRSVMQECKIGETVTYDTLSQAIGRDVRKFAKGPIVTCRRTLLNELNMVFECVPNEGYKRLSDCDIVRSIESDRRKVSRASGKSIRKLSCVDFAALNDQEKHAHTVAAAQFGAIQLFSKSSTTKRIESKVSSGDTTIPVADTIKLFT